MENLSKNSVVPPPPTWSDFDTECIPAYAMNFYSLQWENFVRITYPNSGLLPAGKSIYSFNIDVAQQVTQIANMSYSENNRHRIQLLYGDFVPNNTTPTPLNF